MLAKFGILLCTIFLTTYADIVRQPVKVLNVNGCALKYKKDVSDKPDIFLTTTVVFGLCRLQKHQRESNENYETMKIEYYRRENKYEHGNWERAPTVPGTIQRYNVSRYQSLSYDVRTKSLIYVDRKLAERSYQDTFVRRRFNDSQLMEKFNLRDRYRNSYLEMNDLAYDWRTKNLFFNNGKGISVMNLNKPWKPVDVVVGATIISSFAVHPNAGYLFYVDIVPMDKYLPITSDGVPEIYKGEYKSTIYRTYLDGSNKRQVGPTITHRDAFIANLVIDYHTDRLYWSIPHMNVVQSSKLDGTDVKDVINRGLNYGFLKDSTRAISFDKKYVYYILKNKTVRRFDKESLKEDEDFEIVNDGEGLIDQMVVYDPESHKITTDHPCLVDNGGCEQYCLAWPKDHSKRGPSRTCRNGKA